MYHNKVIIQDFDIIKNFAEVFNNEEVRIVDKRAARANYYSMSD